MTKAQKEEKARNERKLQQMIAAGIKVGGLEEGEGEKEKEKEKEKKKADSRKRAGRRTDKVTTVPWFDYPIGLANANSAF